MTEESLPLAELLAKAGDGDFLRSVAEAVVQLLMETDVEGLIGGGTSGQLGPLPGSRGPDLARTRRNQRGGGKPARRLGSATAGLTPPSARPTGHPYCRSPDTVPVARQPPAELCRTGL
jgi:hypothetical protein